LITFNLIVINSKLTYMKKKSRFILLLTLALILPVVMITLISMSGAGSNATPPRPEGPCDIYAAAGTPCVAAHSSTRALYASYNGPLYQVMRQSDGKTLDIGVVKPGEGDPGGYANATAQDEFCTNTLCWITKIYDQTGKGNHLVQAPPGTFKGTAPGGFDNLPIADMASITISGHKAYGVYIIPGMGLRDNNARDIAINDEPEGIYYVVDGKHYSSGCCFDYGNSSTNSRAVGTGTMETTYYGTATAWGSGNGNGPWIMADMEAGLFSGFNAKKNDVPTIDSWKFVTAVINGGGGNQWDLQGGDAQKGGLTTYYTGVRPGSPASKSYFPMSKKGAILLGNGGDNGNGSAGTFFEGVMTTGYPTKRATDAVQANIVAARYDVQRVKLSRAITFTPKSVQDVTVTFTNTTGMAVTGVRLSILAPKGWTAIVSGSTATSKTIADPVAPNASVSAIFRITSPAITDAGFMYGKVEWISPAVKVQQSEATAQRIRNAVPVKINEVSFGSGSTFNNQFIELYNGSASEAEISDWQIINTQSAWTPVRLAKIPAGTKLASHGFYLLGLSASGLVAPASPGDNFINVRSTSDLEIGQQIDIDGEVCKIKSIGTPAVPMTTLFVPVSTGPWFTIPAGSTNIPVTNAAGFVVGERIGIDLGGKYEVAVVTTVGNGATQTNLAVAAKAGDTSIKLDANSNLVVGDTLIISTGIRKELNKVKRIIRVAAAPAGGGFGQGPNNSEPGEVELATPLKFDHMTGIDVSCKGTGISFSPATRFAHKSGEAIQALGTGITLESKLVKRHDEGAPVISMRNTAPGYQGEKKPNIWYGSPLSTTAGSIALMDASGKTLIDGIVYGSQQSNSSANGTITSPEIATLEGDQSQGGCIVVVPGPERNFRPVATTSQPNRSIGRFPDGTDSDNNCTDFLLQNPVTMSTASEVGSDNIKVASMADMAIGQKITIGTGTASETAVIKTLGTTGGTTLGSATTPGRKVIAVAGVEGFSAGQTITIDNGTNRETAVVAIITPARRRFGNRSNTTPMDSIAVSAPLTIAHAAGVQVSGSGITLVSPLTKPHDNGTQVANNIPTPGGSNQYSRKQ
jgi:non-reducing end alpha-L-arabinofuranosidase